MLLHVYDLNEATGVVNDWVLRPLSIGAFHCGLEVLKTEWFFAWGETEDSGLHRHAPRQHPVHSYKETVSLGASPLTEVEIRRALLDLEDEWPESSYHPITRNCVTFAEAASAKLRAPLPFPPWIRGAAEVGKARVLMPIADLSWEAVKWWMREAPPEITEELPTPPDDADMREGCRSMPPPSAIGLPSAPRSSHGLPVTASGASSEAIGIGPAAQPSEASRPR